MQGRLQVLAKLTAMTTVTVTLHERGSYVPPEAPAFGTSISRTFHGSLGVLTNFGKAVVLIAVALAPWLPALAVLLVPAWLLARRRMLRPAAPVVGASAPHQAAPPEG